MSALSRLRLRWQLLRERQPLATYGLIGTNVAVWGLYSTAPAPRRQATWWAPSGPTAPTPSWKQVVNWWPTKDFWERHFFSSYNTVMNKAVHTLPLCTFMHMDGHHLLFNMLGLFFFGRQLEYVLGTARFLTFYLTSSTVAAASQVASCGPRDPYSKVIGASGGVYALIAYTTCLMPHQTVLLYMIVPVPMWCLMAGLVAIDVFMVRPGEGHTGHLAGASCGAAYWLLRTGRWR